MPMLMLMLMLPLMLMLMIMLMLMLILSDIANTIMQQHRDSKTTSRQQIGSRRRRAEVLADKFGNILHICRGVVACVV